MTGPSGRPLRAGTSVIDIVEGGSGVVSNFSRGILTFEIGLVCPEPEVAAI